MIVCVCLLCFMCLLIKIWISCISNNNKNYGVQYIFLCHPFICCNSHNKIIGIMRYDMPNITNYYHYINLMQYKKFITNFKYKQNITNKHKITTNSCWITIIPYKDNIVWVQGSKFVFGEMSEFAIAQITDVSIPNIKLIIILSLYTFFKTIYSIFSFLPFIFKSYHNISITFSIYF